MLVELFGFGALGRKLARWALGLAAAVVAMAVTAPVSAQNRTFYLDRVQISGAPDDGYVVWRPNMYERTRFYGMMTLGWTLNPLHASTVADTGNEASRINNPVKDEFIDYLNVGTEVASRASFNAQLPIMLYQVSDTGAANARGVGEGLNVNKVALMDARLDLRVKAHESDDRKFRLGFGGAMFLPTGEKHSFTGDGQTSVWLYGSTEYDFGKFLLAGMIGPHFKPNRKIQGQHGALFVGSELRWALGAYVPLRSGRVRLGVELFGSTGLFTKADGPENTFLNSRNTDVEWLGQARFGLGEKQRVWAMVGGGTRLDTAYGSPDVRILASLGGYFMLHDVNPKSPPRHIHVVPDVADYAPDRDHDGYPDDIDKCPDVPEDGKPPDPSDGCPAGSDRDNDGIPDAADACPDVPEDKDGVQDNDGCPEDDADNDQIPDKEDKCPLEPGPPNKKKPEKNGCPGLTKVTESGEVALLEPIQFETGKATIKAVSFPILDEVVTLMKARGNIKMGIYGHTDSVGADAMNLQLSKDRAASVVRYIRNHGIAGSRMESEGFGETKPLDTNDTAEGRAKNRRVEFKILSE
jgi:OmpA-OmpF porin, OOP family